MAEPNKTARASIDAGAAREGKADPFATNEQKIAELRKQRDPKLGQIAVNRFDFIDALIEEYDKLKAQAEADHIAAINAIKGSDDRLRETQAQLTEAKQNLASTEAELVDTRTRLLAEINALSERLSRSETFLSQEELHQEHMDKSLPAPNGQND